MHRVDLLYTIDAAKHKRRRRERAFIRKFFTLFRRFGLVNGDVKNMSLTYSAAGSIMLHIIIAQCDKKIYHIGRRMFPPMVLSTALGTLLPCPKPPGMPGGFALGG